LPLPFGGVRLFLACIGFTSVCGLAPFGSLTLPGGALLFQCTPGCPAR